MSFLHPAEPPETVEAMRDEIARLQKIVAALVQAAERSLDPRGTPYGQFQRTLLLEDRVRERTRQLQTALADADRARAQLTARMVELTETRTQLVRAEKLALAGRLAGAMAHEINTPMCVALANLDDVEQEAAAMGPVLHELGDAAQLLAELPSEEARAVGRRLRELVRERSPGVSLLQGCVADVSAAVRRVSALATDLWTLAGEEDRGTPTAVTLLEIVEQTLGRFPEATRRAAASTVAVPPVFAVAEDVRRALGHVLAFLLVPERRRRPGAPAVGIEPGTARSAIVVVDEGVVPTDDELAAIFDPRIVPDAQRAGTMRLDVDLALAQVRLARCGGDLTVGRSADGGMLFRVLLLNVEDGLSVR